MTRALRLVRARLAAVATAASVLLAACQPSIPSMTPKEQAFMNDYTAHMVPHCVGRYLIDLPEDMQPGKMAAATFTIDPFSGFNEGVHVRIKPLPYGVFESALSQRKAKLESVHMDGKPDQAYLGSIEQLRDNSGIIINRADGALSRGARMLELHGWKGGYAIKMTMKANDVNYPEYKSNKQLQALGSDVKPKLAMLQSLYARTSGRKPSEIPTVSGTCIQNGFISGPASDKMREDIAMDFVSKKMPDVVFALTSNSGSYGAGDTLLDRVPAFEANFKAAKGHLLHKGRGASKVGLAYEEVLATGLTPTDHVMGQIFTLEANSKGGAQTPLVNVSLYNGDRENPRNPPEDDLYRIPVPQTLPPLAKASLTEAESVALWDAVAKTLRKRPGAF